MPAQPRDPHPDRRPYVALVALIIIFIGASIPIGDAFPAWSSSSAPAGVSAPYH